MRTGCQWNQLPKKIGDDSSVHRTMQRWVTKGVFERIWAVLIEKCEDLGGVDWDWQSADGVMGKARFWGTLPDRTPRIAGKTARSAAQSSRPMGGPSGVAVAWANVHDTKLLERTIEAIVVDRPETSKREPQHLCLDKGYDNPTGHAAVGATDYTPHIRRIGGEKLDK